MQLDSDHANSIDGLNGGAYAPVVEIDIGGVGLGKAFPGTAGGTMPWDVFANDRGSDGTAACRSFDRVAGLVGAIWGASGAWNQIMTSVPQAAYLQGTNSNSPAMCKLELFDQAVLQQVIVNFAIVGGHSSLPSNFPSFQVLQIAKATGTVTVVASGVLSAGSTAAYEALTSITLTPGVTTTIDRTLYHYWLRIFDDNGGGALPGNKYHSAVATSRASQFRYA